VKQFVGTVGAKGQVTLPIEVRKQLGIEPKDKVLIEVVDNKAVVRRGIRSVMDLYGSVPPLKRKLTDRQVREIAMEEMAQEAARKGLD
jgi:AbrB family looped-hinge helix DNA binding protein